MSEKILILAEKCIKTYIINYYEFLSSKYLSTKVPIETASKEELAILTKALLHTKLYKASRARGDIPLNNWDILYIPTISQNIEIVEDGEVYEYCLSIVEKETSTKYSEKTNSALLTYLIAAAQLFSEIRERSKEFSIDIMDLGIIIDKDDMSMYFKDYTKKIGFIRVERTGDTIDRVTIE